MAELLRIQDLSVWYEVRGGTLARVQSHVKAVRHVDFTLQPGEIVAVVGESGCGKTTFASALLGLRPWQSGKLWLDGKELDPTKSETWKAMRLQVQMVFQDPNGSLNPRQTLRELVSAPLRASGVPAAEIAPRVAEALEQVGLSTADLDKFPHAFSGGQRQRIGIARALALRSRVLVCDEPTSALDVSVQAQILQLLQDLRNRLGLAIVLITHDLSVVRALTDRVLVMYLGSLVESAPTTDLFRAPLHPYTKALLASVPTLDPGNPPQVLEGDIPSLTDLPTGCVFAGRCPIARDECRQTEPALTGVGSRLVRCPWTGNLR